MSQKKYGVLLVNLGTPSEPTAKGVRNFLKAFLSDPRVVDLPRLLWLPILYLFILTFRPKRVAQNYRKIWLKEGAPLLVYSRQQQQKLQAVLKNQHNQQTSQSDQSDQSDELEYEVELGMTYGEPSINQAVHSLLALGAEQIIVLPLYPQFSYTTTAAVSDQTAPIEKQLTQKFIFIKDYHDNSVYIQALAKSIKEKLTPSVDKVIFSYHGIPKRYVNNGDPYQSQCQKTTQLVVEQLNLNTDQWELAFQSRFGKEEWLQPYLDQRMQQLPAEGVKNILVVCPGFSCDCLETLEEIAMENKQIFMEHGGEQFYYLPALNARQSHIEMMAKLIIQQAN